MTWNAKLRHDGANETPEKSAMAKTRTFVDACVLIAAARGNEQVSPAAMAILDDPERVYVTSDFVRLEVLPKPKYHRKDDEVVFYETFFECAEESVEASREIVKDAQTEAESHGLSALDALHVIAAKLGKCEVLVTSEKRSQNLFRNSAVPVMSIHRPT